MRHGKSGQGGVEGDVTLTLNQVRRIDPSQYVCDVRDCSLVLLKINLGLVFYERIGSLFRLCLHF
jgi:hypothetical protein